MGHRLLTRQRGWQVRRQEDHLWRCRQDRAFRDRRAEGRDCKGRRRALVDLDFLVHLQQDFRAEERRRQDFHLVASLVVLHLASSLRGVDVVSLHQASPEDDLLVRMN